MACVVDSTQRSMTVTERAHMESVTHEVICQSTSPCYLISLDSIPKSFASDSVICLETPQKVNDLHNSLINAFAGIPDGAFVLLYLKIHGSSSEKKDIEDENLQIFCNTELVINANEIVSAIQTARSGKGLTMCGLLNICYGYTYTNLINCFDISYSSSTSSTGGSPHIHMNILDFMKGVNSETFLDDFENSLCVDFSNIVNQSRWILGEIDSVSDNSWIITKNEGYIKFSRFLKNWNSLIQMKRYKYTEIEMRDHLIKCGANTSYLVHEYDTFESLKSLMDRLFL